MKNFLSFSMLTLLIIFLITSIAPSQLSAQLIGGPDHYKTWRNMFVPIEPPIGVNVQDQFMTGPCVITGIEFLSNPVMKIHNNNTYEITKPNNHLNWYQLAPNPILNINVEYYNQFETTSVLIDYGRYLLVPTQKAQHAPPESLSHYKAYGIVNPRGLKFEPPVQFEDQFDPMYGGAELIDSMVPKYFLTPASKNSEEIYDHITHYVAYEIFPKRVVPMFEIYTKDQFGDHFLNIQNSELVLVPSRKTPNHFKTWRMEMQLLDPNIEVYVKDQFMTDQYWLTGIEFLSNPVKKIHGDKTYSILNQNNHLTWYQIKSVPVNINIGYINQIESTTIVLDTINYLLVPTQKETHGPPSYLDHYKAYKISNSIWKEASLTLEDQFDISSGMLENIDSIKATYFLTPALKAHGEPNFPLPLFDSVHHYVAYEIKPKEAQARTVNTEDQFGTHICQILNSEYLLVPSIKFIPPPPPDTGRNHYKTWKTGPIPYKGTAHVEDQFMTDNIELLSLEYISNPSRKVHDQEIFDIVDPDAHLNWYKAEGRDTLLLVSYTNQIETNALPIGSFEYLLVPSQKLPHAPPQKIDHYKAYQIINPQTIYLPLTLQDQFDELMALPEQIESLTPRYFLTPAIKNYEPFYDTVTHYVAYEINPKREFQYGVTTVDQFGDHEMYIQYSDLLLVPTAKLSVEPPPDSLFGSLCGKKCNDLNGNGICDPTEPNLANWDITLTTPTGTITVQTNQQGAYCFTGLMPGQYTISETVKPGWQQTGPQPPGTYPVILQAGQHLSGFDFANIRIPDFDSLLNHYKAWEIGPIPFEIPVTVEDQFMKEDILLTGIHFISNPTRKMRYQVVSNIVEPDYHFTWYGAIGKDTLLNVTYINQFESTAVFIDSVKYLLVPAQKLPHSPPDSADHYKAYKIRDRHTIYTPTLVLEDQFNMLMPEVIDSIVAVYFLTPASKNMEPMYDTLTHYVAYEIFPKQYFQIMANTIDQFGPHELSVQNSKFLLVPTLKLSVTSPYTDTVSVSANSGWNMLSVPLIVPDYRKSVLFPSAISGAFAYEGTYIEKDTLINGVGYWLKFSASETIDMIGIKLLNYTVPVVEGWNLIGSIGEPIATSSISSVPGGIITSQFFEYTTAYEATDTLKPGKGYWVKVSQAGQLILSSTLFNSANRIRIIPTSELPPSPPDQGEVGIKSVPLEYSLGQNYPNPFNPTTVIKFELPDVATVKLTVYNTLGQAVAVLLDGVEMQAGLQMVSIDARNMPSGVYYYKLEADGKSGKSFTSVKKMVILK